MVDMHEQVKHGGDRVREDADEGSDFEPGLFKEGYAGSCCVGVAGADHS